MALCAMMGTATLTSCEGTLDDVFGEWSRPTKTEPTLSIEETPLSFEAVEAGTIQVIYQGDLTLSKPITYTKNGVSTSITATTDIAVAAGDVVSFSSENSSVNDDATGWLNILADHKIYVYGNVMSLINDEGDFSKDKTISGNFALAGLFDGNKSLYNHPEKKLLLPATTLSANCYSQMFSKCNSLTTAPELPATTLAEECYTYMFYGCTSLTTAPALPATTLAKECYYAMFNQCTSLTTAPALPATTLATGCYYKMFYNCSALSTAPVLPATTLAVDCYREMFNSCTSLTTAPELPATTLTENCYDSMFAYCTGLTTAPKLPATTLATQCYSGIFLECTSLTTAPELPATTLATQCYEYMFYKCTKLSSVTCLATDITATSCTDYWLNCAGIDASVTSRTLHIKTGQSTTDANWDLSSSGDGGTMVWTAVADM